MAVKAIATDKVADELELLAKLESPTEFLVARVKRSVEQLKSVDQASYNMFLGVFYAIIGDFENSRDSHERSLRYSSDLTVYLNYAVSARRLGRFFDSYEILKRNLNSNPGSVNCFTELVDTMISLGDFREFDALRDKVLANNPGARLQDYDVVTHVNRVRHYLGVAGVSEEEYMVACGVVNEILLQNNVYMRSNMVDMSSFDGVSHVTTRLAFQCSDVDKLARVNEMIADAIISEERLTAWDRLVFTVVPLGTEPTSRIQLA